MTDRVAQDGAIRPVARDVAEAIKAYQRAVLVAREAWSISEVTPANEGLVCLAHDASEHRDEAGRRLLTLLARLAVEADR